MYNNLKKLYCKDFIPFIKENLNHLQKVTDYSSNTSYFWVNAANKDLFGVGYALSKDIKTFSTIKEAVEYANTLPVSDTMKLIGVKGYGNRKFTIVANF